MAKLGFIGTGTMGNPIAARLLDAEARARGVGRVARGRHPPMMLLLTLRGGPGGS